MKLAYTQDLVIFAVLYRVCEIGLHTELSYIGCVIQCK
jgi:hypothetical protein